MDFQTFFSTTTAAFYDLLWWFGIIVLGVLWFSYELSTRWREHQADRRRRLARRESWKDWRP